MSIEELVKKHFDRWVTDTEFGNVEAHMRAALTEQAETHALELRAYEATVQNMEQRVRELEAQRVPDGYVMVPVEPTDAMQKVQTWDFDRFYSSAPDQGLQCSPPGDAGCHRKTRGRWVSGTGVKVNEILFGDCRETMRKLAADGARVQTCVTSPPYFGLRDYGHEGQIGLEQTPEEYIAAMVEVFRCVRDVLADDGTLWVNIGDSYAGAGYSNNKNTGGTARVDGGKQRHLSGTGCKNKDLIGIPWMLAFALRADGWYLRQDIIWHKPNPMPESVRDRCTKAHEYVFLLSKSERYFFDSEAVMEPVASSTIERLSQPTLPQQEGSTRVPGKTNGNMKAVGRTDKRNRRSVWTVSTKPYKGAHFATFPLDLIEPCILAGSRPGDIVLDPFMGSGTTAAVAIKLGRQYIGCELNPEYSPLQQERIASAQAEALVERARLSQTDIFEVARNG